MPLTDDEKLAEVNVALGRGSVRIGSMPFWRKFMAYVYDKVSLSNANEFDTLTKVTPAPTDRFMVEDASDSFNKKYVEIQDLPSGGGGAWGSITGTLSDQTDLQGALDDKADSASLGTMAGQNDSAVAITGGTAKFDPTGLSIGDGGSWKIEIRNVGTHSADNVLEVDMNDGNRSISLNGNLTVGGTASVSGTNTGDQAVPSEYDLRSRILRL